MISRRLFSAGLSAASLIGRDPDNARRVDVERRLELFKFLYPDVTA
jgi:hypothetical protein